MRATAPEQIPVILRRLAGKAVELLRKPAWSLRTGGALGAPQPRFGHTAIAADILRGNLRGQITFPPVGGNL